MWKRRIEFLRRMLRMLQDFFAINLLVTLLFVTLTKEQPTLVLPVILLALYITSMIIREYVVRNLYIVLLHMAMALLLLLLPVSWPLKLMLAAAVVFHMMPKSLAYSSFGGRLFPLDGTPWPMFLLTLVTYIAGISIEENVLVTAAYVTLFLGLFTYLILVYVEGIVSYMDATKDVSGLPLKNILSVNTSIVGLILLVLLLVSALIGLFNPEHALKLVARSALAVLRVIGYFCKYAFLLLNIMTKTSNAGLPEARNFEEEHVEGEIKHALASGEIFIKLFLLGILVWIFVKMGSKIIKWFIMRRRRDTGYVVEYSATPKAGVDERAQRKKRLLFKDNREKARHAYKVRISRHSAYFPLKNSMTCGEIRDSLFEKELDDVEDLTALYERIRYTEEPVDKALLKQMRRLSKD